MSRKGIPFVTTILSALVLVVSFQNCDVQGLSLSEGTSESLVFGNRTSENKTFLTCRIQNTTLSDLHMSADILPKDIHSGSMGGFFVTARSEGYVITSSQGDRFERDDELFILNSNNVWTKVTSQNMRNLLESPSSGLVTLNSSGYSFDFSHGLDISAFQAGNFKIFIGYGIGLDGESIWNHMMDNSSSQLQECYSHAPQEHPAIKDPAIKDPVIKDPIPAPICGGALVPPQ
jgi:hypothetical protein